MIGSVISIHKDRGTSGGVRMRNRRVKSQLRCHETNVEIRKISVDSLDPLILNKLYRLVLRIKVYYLLAGAGWDRSKKLDEMKYTPGLTYQVAYSGGEIVGFISYVQNQESPWLNTPVTFIWELHVAPDAKRKGVGKRLIELVAAGTDKTVMLRTFKCNEQAVEFYKSMQFKIREYLGDEISLIMEMQARSQL